MIGDRFGDVNREVLPAINGRNVQLTMHDHFVVLKVKVFVQKVEVNIFRNVTLLEQSGQRHHVIFHEFEKLSLFGGIVFQKEVVVCDMGNDCVEDNVRHADFVTD